MNISEEVWFEKINGEKIFGILSEPENKLNKMIIMSHGFRGSSIGPARTFGDFARILNENGFSVLRYDQPNSGNSEGDYINSSFKQWVETITYFGKKYLEAGYEVNLLGQSMGASATMISTNQPKLKDKINKIILWVPDPETDFCQNPEDLGEEGGQIYKNRFWNEAKEMDFFGCMNKFNGKVHLVYGEFDRYVTEQLRNETISKAREKEWQIMILPGQDHSPWDYKMAQKVYEEEIEFLKQK